MRIVNIGFNPLEVLREANRNLPSLKYTWGIVGLSAASSLAISFHGDGKSAAIAGGVSLVGFILVLVATTAARGGSYLLLPAKVLVWAITIIFLVFLTFTVTAYAISWPCNWVNFIGITSDKCGAVTSPTKLPSNGIKDESNDYEVWAKNWEYLKLERLNRRSRDCNGINGSYKVYDRRPIIQSLKSLNLNSFSSIGKLRDDLLMEIETAPKATSEMCSTLGNFSNVDLLMDDLLKPKWDQLKIEIKAKATKAGVDLTFQWDV